MIKIAAIDSEAPPLFHKSRPGAPRTGYEPEVAELVLGAQGIAFEWVYMAWDDMIPAVRSGACDAVWCGQGITPERSALVDFTTPYALFNETVIVRADDPARAPGDLRGYRIGAIAGSTNEKLARTFDGIELVGFGGSDDVFEEMIEATRRGVIDGVVDDDVVNLPLVDRDPAFVTAFVAQTRNRWGVGVAPGNDALREDIDRALAEVIGDGRLEEVWRKWMPLLPYPFAG